MKTRKMKNSLSLNPKDKIQSRAVELSVENRYLCLEWSTGCGKTLAAAKIVSNIIEGNPDAKGYLICKESTHKKNWIDDLKKHGMNNVIDSLKNVLYASLKNQKEKADFIILDECHALTILRLKALSKIMSRNTKVILLSATISKDKKYLINSFFGEVHFNKIPLVKAIELKLLPEPSLVVHKVKLNEEIVDGKYWEFKARSPKDKKSGIYKKCSHKDMFVTMKNNSKNWGIICLGTEKEHYDALTKQMAYFKGLSEDFSLPYPVREGCRNKWLNTASVRKKFIAEVKTERVKELVNKFREVNSRFICFTGSINQSKELGSDSSVHSKNSKEHNQELIDCFNRMECSELFAVKMLREGINLTQIEKGIITQLDSTIGSFFQMLGRCLRHEFPEMHLMLLEDTQDVKYFNNSMENFDDKYITWA